MRSLKTAGREYNTGNNTEAKGDAFHRGNTFVRFHEAKVLR